MNEIKTRNETARPRSLHVNENETKRDRSETTAIRRGKETVKRIVSKKRTRTRLIVAVTGNATRRRNETVNPAGNIENHQPRRKRNLPNPVANVRRKQEATDAAPMRMMSKESKKNSRKPREMTAMPKIRVKYLMIFKLKFYVIKILKKNYN